MSEKYIVQELHSSSGKKYIGLKVRLSDITPYLEQLEMIVGLDEYLLLANKQKSRDKGQYHLTLISPEECKKLSELELKDIKGAMCELKLLGLGVANKGSAFVYYVVSQSDSGNKAREILKLPPKDFHITIGFNESDLHDVVKDSTTIIPAPTKVFKSDS